MALVIEMNGSDLVWSTKEDRFVSESNGAQNRYATKAGAERAAVKLTKRGYSVTVREETKRSTSRVDWSAMVSN